MRSVVVAAALGALALPAAAQTMQSGPPASSSTTTAAPSGQTPAPPSGQAARGQPDTMNPKPVCKTSTPAGTRFAKRECHTQAEWDQMATDARQSLTDTSHSTYSGPH